MRNIIAMIIQLVTIAAGPVIVEPKRVGFNLLILTPAVEIIRGFAVLSVRLIDRVIFIVIPPGN